MKRSDFLKRLGIGSALLVTAPKVLAGVFSEKEKDNLIPTEKGHFVKDDFLTEYPLTTDEAFPYGDSGLHKVLSGYKDDNIIFFTRNHCLMPNDYVMVSDGKNNSNFIVTETLNNKIRVACFKKKESINNGEVEVLNIYRKYQIV